MKLSVVILNYNVRYFLEQCILSVQRAMRDLDAEIIVVDNASQDDSCAMVKQYFPSVILIENKENVGFSKANNQGVAIAKGEYICILNPDTAVAEDTFAKCISFAKANTDLGALGIYYLDGTGNFLPESKRNLPTPTRSLLKILGIAGGRRGYYAKYLNEKETGKVEILAGAFMFLKREVYLEVGGFDEDYFMYGEDIDICYKLMQAGYTNYYDGSNCVLHYKGESTQKDAAYLDRFYGAMQIFYKKHFSKNKVTTAFVSFGVKLTKAFKGTQSNRNKNDEHSAEEVWVLTEDLSLLKSLSEIFEIPVKSVAKRAVEEDLVSNKMIVFDSQYLSYKFIFQLMEKQKNRGNTFRIKPPKSQFIIGSDQSDQKGGTVLL
ncbi:glycosyltransferase family 2 protein [Aureisphaera sp. CAU 1614]|uniref:Glycosyltransferase family 2 protein n=1 Tax=Halomarinibacterium sedimenti TaxID=2857106 RepID=A0A9X1FNK0_9FLAO|nr:glycosyltransferase family 2 protein [Halomarinibacterium sedimenti]MBW2937870.1 glycosyltransferase family 2 protein [Halomarinibacterium sedimenti]